MDTLWLPRKHVSYHGYAVVTTETGVTPWIHCGYQGNMCHTMDTLWLPRKHVSHHGYTVVTSDTDAPIGKCTSIAPAVVWSTSSGWSSGRSGMSASRMSYERNQLAVLLQGLTHGLPQLTNSQQVFPCLLGVSRKPSEPGHFQQLSPL